jgi:PAS domain S-box-containing protein
MIDQSPSATSIYSKNGDLVYYNNAFVQLWNFTEEGINEHKKSYNLFLDPKFIDNKRKIKKVFSNGNSWKKSPVKYISTRKGKKDMFVSAIFYPIKKEDNSVQEIVLIEEDISPLLQTNNELRRNLKELSVLKDALDISNIITEVDVEGTIIRANEKFYTISGYTKRNLNSLTIYELRSGNMEQYFYDDLWNTVRKGKIWKGEMENRAKSGELYWTETTIVPLIDSSKNPETFLGISSNITERKKAEQEIIKLNSKLEKEVINRTEDIKKAIEELEAFSYSVSHDLRAPLRAITGFSGLLKDEFGDRLNGEAKRYLEIIQNGTYQMAQLIDDLLQFSRVGRMELQKIMFDPNKIVRDIMYREKANSNAEFFVDTIKGVYGDPNMIILVFTNLIQNAIKFSQDVKNPKIYIGSYEGENETIYFIKDNGVGFDMRYSDKLFKVFQRLHSTQQFEGTGVGLAIVARIVEKHGGRVWGESYEDSDTSFYFSLPHETDDE